MKITSPALQQRLAQQIASTSGVEVRCGAEQAVPSASEREQFRS
jgi:hypothetical protein